MFLEEKKAGEAKVVTPAPYSAASILSFLRDSPSEKGYDYRNCTGCLHAEYSRHLGMSYAKQRVCTLAEFLAFERRVAAPTPWTFGAALARAETLVEEGVFV